MQSNNNNCSEVGRIIVSGYDTSLPKDVVETALRNHFSECGKITDVCVSKNILCPTKKLYDSSYIYFIGEDAVDKALVLNGTDVGGWTINIKPYPFIPDAKLIIWVHLQGFDTSHSKTDNIKQALIELFSSCGVVRDSDVHVFKTGSADLIVKGEDAAEKVLKLDLSSFMGHPKLVLRHVCYREIRTVHRRPLHLCGGRKRGC